jgi:hypothetical protein
MHARMLLALLSIPLSPAAAQTRLTQADLLRRVTDLERLTTPPPAGEVSGLFSSFDRAALTVEGGRYVHWDADDDFGQFLRRTEDGWDVMAEMTGPGVITRLWSSDPEGQIRIVLDGRTVLERPFVELFNGATEPFGEPLTYQTAPDGGWNCYFPIGYARSCLIAARESRSHYQIDYTTLPPGTEVATFDPQLDEDAQAALRELVAAMQRGLSEKQVLGDRRTMTLALQDDVPPGRSLGDSLEKGGTVRALYVSLTDRKAPRELYALHQCVLRIWWDGQERPAVEAPLCDFFGSGFDRVAFRSLVIGTDYWSALPGEFPNEGWFMYCYLPMPFSTGMRIEIANHSPRKIGLMYYARIDRAAPPADALRFFARYRREAPCKVFDLPVLAAGGPGRFVGCVLNVDCPRAEWWGSGDHKVWLDDAPVPVLLGTGTADYFGDAPPLRPFARAFHGVTRTGPYGKSSMFRWHVGDCINFQRSIRLVIENWQKNEADDTDYETIACWYGPAGPPPEMFKPLRAQDLVPAGLRVPGAVEIEGRVAGTGWGQVLKETNAGVELSGREAVSIQTSEPVEITIPAQAAGTVKLKLRVLTGRSFKSIEVSTADGGEIGSVQYDYRTGGVYEVGRVSLKEGDNVVRVRCSGNPVLDCWILEPAP